MPETAATPSFWLNAVRRIARERAAVLGGVVLLLLILAAIFAPYVAPHDPLQVNPAMRLKGRTPGYLLGHDELGRDILSRLIYGARTSLSIGLVSVSIGVFGGGLLGLLAGYYRWLDNPIMRLIDILMAFPFVLRAVAVVAILGPGLFNAMIAVGFGGVPAFARLVRSQVLSLREQAFVEAARAGGSTDGRILLRHVLPNSVAPIIVYATLTMATSILSASTLSFLGLGVQPPTPEWGDMASQGRNFLRAAPHVVVWPSVAISVVVLAFNLLGDGLRDALDPRLKE